MPSNHPNTPARVRPTLLFWVVATAALALFGVFGSVTLVVVDADYVDLPNPMVTFVGIFGATATVICVILGMAHLLRVASAENTQAGIVAITAARTDLKADTGEIPGLAAAMRNPHYIVVRDPGPFDKADRDRTMRVTGEADPTAVGQAAVSLPEGMAKQIWDMSERATERRLRGDSKA